MPRGYREGTSCQNDASTRAALPTTPVTAALTEPQTASLPCVATAPRRGPDTAFMGTACIWATGIPGAWIPCWKLRHGEDRQLARSTLLLLRCWLAIGSRDGGSSGDSSPRALGRRPRHHDAHRATTQHRLQRSR
jgi:hypothetical protein